MADSIDQMLDIEHELKKDFDIGMGDPKWKPLPTLTARSRDLLNSWLGLNGVLERKRVTMSDEGKVRAFRAGRRWVVENIVLDKRTPKRGVIDVNLDDLLDAPLGGQIGEGDHGWDEPTPTPLPEPNSPNAPNVPPMQISARDIQRAAEAVIIPRINDATRQLITQISTEINSKFTSSLADLSAEISSKIRGIATDAAGEIAAQVARKMIDENLPRRLEIILPDRRKINLPAEPRHEAFDEILDRLGSGQHVYGVGPAGTGKTHMAKQLAAGLGYDLDTEFFPIDQSLTKFDVKGYKGPTGEYVDTLVRRCVEHGGFLFIDESDMWFAPALGSLNSILANDYGAFPDRTVAVHPNFRCFVCANTFGHGATMQYQGRNPLDAASLDRFAYTLIDYDNKLETAIYGDVPWVRYVQRVRAAVDQLKLQHVVSMRASARGLKDLSLGFNAEKICFSQLWRGLAPDTVAKIQTIAGTFTIDKSEPAEPTEQELDLPDNLLEFEKAIAAGNKARAIHIYRQVFGRMEVGLRDAKEFVEDIMAGKVAMPKYSDHADWALWTLSEVGA